MLCVGLMSEVTSRRPAPPVAYPKDRTRPDLADHAYFYFSHVGRFRRTNHLFFGDCSIATGADSKIARQEQGESTWDPLNACELAPNSANSLIPSLIAWAKSQPPGNVAIVSFFETDSLSTFTNESRRMPRPFKGSGGSRAHEC